MKKQLKNVAILLGALLIGSAALAGCGGQTSDPDPDPDPGPAPSPTLSLDITETTLFENAQVTLTATLENSAARVVWSSDDISVASVKGNDKTALVTAGSEGECSVTAKAGDLTASCAITVIGNPYYAINLPMNKLILNRTGDHASLKVILNDDSIDPEKLVWTVSDEEVCTVETYLTTAYITAGKKGDCNLTVSYDTGEGIVSSSCAITVRNTATVVENKPEIKETLYYYAFTAAGVRSEKTYRGLSNAINALVSEAGYGEGSYIATTTDPDTVVYTYKAVPYHFLNRSDVYHGFDTFEQVENGQASWWTNWPKEVDLYRNDTTNMLQLTESYAKSYYYRPTDWSLGGYSAVPSDTWAGWRSSVYAAAGACAQYSSWADDNALGLKGVEQVYDLSSATMTPSLGTQNVYAEIWTAVWYPSINEEMPYYGAYFDAGTKTST
ncbi:MAG: Ig-like domain-containing protein, partial [Clostridia bacterium]|nr:Ig-like domain-containing protein [Clostridia bacterium]